VEDIQAYQAVTLADQVDIQAVIPADLVDIPADQVVTPADLEDPAGILADTLEAPAGIPADILVVQAVTPVVLARAVILGDTLVGPGVCPPTPVREECPPTLAVCLLTLEVCHPTLAFSTRKC